MNRAAVEDRAAALRRDGVAFVLARVVRAERPTSAKPGDEAVVFADGTLEGFVGGTCAEATVRAQALTLLDSGEPLLLRITPEVEHPPAPDQDGTLTVHNPCLSGGTIEVFLQPELPSPVLVVHGGTPIAQSLAALAGHVGFRVREATAQGPPDPAGAAAVVCASHGRDEEEGLTAALTAAVPYVGLVASRKRGEAVVASLPVNEAARARVHTPAGLDIGARTPEEVALSILAEMVAERRRASGRPVASVASELPLAQEQPHTATDPVCGMTVPALDTSLHLDHDGVRYWFCGSGCLRAFAADPSGYLTS